MTWTNFFLFCFAFGFFFSLVSAVSGHLHFGGHDAGHGGGHDLAHGHPHSGGHGHVHGHDHGHGHAHDAGPHEGSGQDRDIARARISPFNMGTISAFLAWFGGTGYLATRFYHLWIAFTLVAALGAGLAGAGLVYLFLSRVLMRGREDLDPADYDMIGVLGLVTGNIRSEGIGEIMFSQKGVRRATPARSADHKAIPHGTEVVVTKYEGGVAYVRRWDDWTTGVADLH